MATFCSDNFFKYTLKRGLFNPMTSLADENLEHPDDRSIREYLKAPDSGAFDGLRLHLAGCGQCRRRTELTAMLIEQAHWLESEPCETDPRLADLVADRMEPGQAAQLRAEIKEDPARLRAALHFASHALAMRELGETRRQPEPGTNGLVSLVVSWLNFEAPVWKLAPIVAVVMTVAILLFDSYPAPGSGGEIRIVAFEDEQLLQFVSQETQPGIGFFSRRNTQTTPYAGVGVEWLDDKRLRLSWPEIVGATGYNLKLQVFRDGETRVLAKRTLAATSVELPLDEPLAQHRYEWILSGNTDDGRSFQADGGFVVTTN